MTTCRQVSKGSTALVILISGLGIMPHLNAETSAASGSYLSHIEDIVVRMAKADSQKGLNLQEFSVVRRYVLKNPRLSHDAVMKVRWSYVKGNGKSFEVLDSTGAEGVGKKILDRVLEAEEEAGGPGRRENSRLTEEHYSFRLLGMETFRGRPCYLVELQPKVKSRFLLSGKAWIDARDFSPLRVEGRPSASLSFFVGKPYIVQEFQKVGDFYMASYNWSRSQSHILGDSELTVEYNDYEVRSVEGVRVALRHCTSSAPLN